MSKQNRKLADDSVDFFGESLKRRNNVLTIKSMNIAELYISGICNIWLRIDPSIRENADSEYIRIPERYAIIKPCAEWDRAEEKSISANDTAKPSASTAKSGDQEIVSVMVAELLDQPKRLVPSIIRVYDSIGLNSADKDIDSIRTNLGFLSIIDQVVESGKVLINRKLSSRAPVLPLPEGYVKMIQRTDKIKTGVPDNCSPHLRHGFVEAEIHNVILNSKINLGKKSISIAVAEKNSRLRFEIVDVVVGPFELEV